MRRNAGFTLIEIVISMAIISIALVTLVTVMNQTVATAAENSALTDAVMLAQEKLYTAGDGISAALPEPGVSDWESDERYPRLTYRKTVTETPLSGIRQVKVEVRHDKRDIFLLESYLINK